MGEPEPLHLYDKEEWWDVMRRIRPDIDRNEFEEFWDDAQAMKAKRELN